MIDYLKSETLKNYYRKNHIELDDKLKYALIIYSGAPINDCIASIKELMEATQDEEIKEQGPIWIRNQEKEYESFSRDGGHSYCYKGQYWDEKKNDIVYGIYGTLDVAVMAGINAAKDEGFDRFEVVKEYMPSTEEEFIKHEVSDEDDGTDWGRGNYLADGTLMSVWGRVDDVEEIEDPIEERYYEIPHPFKRGDIVKSSYDPEGSKNYYVVTLSRKEELEHIERIRSYRTPVWEDIWIVLECIDLETGLIWDVDSPSLPTELELCQVKRQSDDLGEWILAELSDMYRGEPFSLQHIQNGLMKLREDYDNKQKYNLLYSSVLKKSTMLYVFG